MLTQEQIQSFKNDGVLVLRNFFSPREINLWKKEVHNYYKKPITALDWKNTIMKNPSSNFHLNNEPHPSYHSKMKKLYYSLHNKIEWQGNIELVARRPELDAEWLGAIIPHLDFPLYANIRTLANNIFYLNDVKKYEGPFMYWKGSHKIAWKYFKNNPEDYMAQGDLSQGQVFEILTNLMQSKPIPFTGKSGDLLIWHSLLLHSPSVNISSNARLAMIGRWGKNIEENESRFNFSEDIWKNWSFKNHNLI